MLVEQALPEQTPEQELHGEHSIQKIAGTIYK
jgi:hypothetical protein